MSALDDIEAAAAALNTLTAQEAAEKARIDASVATALQATMAQVKLIYLDQVAGLDTNDGSTPQRAVATLGAALGLIGAGQFGSIQLLSDVTVTDQISLEGRASITSYGVAAAGTGGTIRTVTIAPSAVGPSYPGSCAVGMLGTAWLEFYHATLSIGAIRPAVGTTAVFSADGTIVLAYATLALDPGLAVPVFSAGVFLQVLFNVVTLPAGYGGKLFLGTPAGGNPNSATVRTNLLAA